MTYSAMERFNDALKGEPRDRVPIIPMIAGWSAINFSDIPLSEMSQDPRRIAEAQIRAMEEIGFDAFFCYADALFVPEAFGCSVHYRETGPIADPIPLSITSIADIDDLPIPDPRGNGRLACIHQVVQALSKYSGGNIPVLAAFEGAFTTTCRIFEPGLILRMIMKNKKALHALLDRINKFLLEFGRALIENGANVIFLPDPSASASMISPSMFREFVLPRLQKITNALTVPCILHICGETGLLLNLMDQSGARILSLDQCMDLAESRAMVPEAVLGGNVDPINSLLLGTKEQVIQDTLDCLRKGGKSRFVLMSGCGVPPGTTVENLKTMVDTAIQYGLGL